MNTWSTSLCAATKVMLGTRHPCPLETCKTKLDILPSRISYNLFVHICMLTNAIKNTNQLSLAINYSLPGLNVVIYILFHQGSMKNTL